MNHVKDLLAEIGIEPERVEMYNMSSAMGAKFAEIAHRVHRAHQGARPQPRANARGVDGHAAAREALGGVAMPDDPATALPRSVRKDTQMITAERKPFDEILALVEGKKKVLVAGCDTCVAICLTGGEKEAEILASELRIKAKQDGREVAVEHTAAIRQCEWEYLDMIADKVEEADVVAQHGLRHRHPEHGREVRAQARACRP